MYGSSKARNALRIGFISEALPYLPARDGFRIHGANLIRCLSRSHTIDLVSLQRDDDQQHLRWAEQYCESASAIPMRRHANTARMASFLSAFWRGRQLHFREEFATALDDGIRRKQWDVLHVEGEFVAGLVAEELPIPKILALHDSWVLRCEEMLKCSLAIRDTTYYSIMKWHETRYGRLVFPRFARCTVVAARDEAAVRRIAPNARVTVIPNGTDIEYFQPSSVEKEPATVVFHGHLSYPPNIASACELVKQVLPLIRQSIPEAVLHLVGSSPTREVVDLATHAGVRLSANVVDIRPLLSSAQVYVCAVRHGSGMKNKLLEAMALGIPVVSYPEAVVGIQCVPGKQIVIAETPEELASYAVELLRHPEGTKALVDAGRALIEQEYSWEAQSRRYEALYQAVLAERTPPGFAATALSRR